MSTIPETDTDFDSNERTVTLAEMDAGVGSIPDVPEDEIAARYYSDEEFLTAIRLRRDNRTTD